MPQVVNRRSVEHVAGAERDQPSLICFISRVSAGRACVEAERDNGGRCV